MAYGVKYTTTYCDVYGRTCIARILQEDWTGAITELEAQTTPFTITYDSSGDFKFSPIRFSSCSLNLVLGNGVDLAEFWTQSEREYKIEHFIDSVTDWIGWVVPNGFKYQVTGGAYFASLEATDGLEALEARPFINEATGNNYGVDSLGLYHNTFDFSLIRVLTEALKKTDLGLDVWVAIDLYEQTMPAPSDSRNGCPLTWAYVNVKTYIEDTDRDDIPYWRDATEAYNTIEVLQNLCYMFAAKCYQENGHWVVKRVNADIDFTDRYYYKFDEEANYIVGRVALSDFKAIPCLSTDWETALIDDDHFLIMDEVYKAYRVNYKYRYTRSGDIVNLILNGDFEAPFSALTFTGAPENWFKWRASTDKWLPRLEVVSILAINQGQVSINNYALKFGTAPVIYPQPTDENAAVWAGLQYGSTIAVNQGDQFTLNFKTKSQPRINGYVDTAAMIYVELRTADGGVWNLCRKYEGGNALLKSWAWYAEPYVAPYTMGPGYMTMPPSPLYCAAAWWHSEEYEDLVSGAKLYADNQWLNFNWQLDALPAAGTLIFRIHGLAASEGRDSENFRAFHTLSRENTEINRVPFWKTVRLWSGVERLLITDIHLGTVPNTGDREKFKSYIEENIDQSYTVQKKPIEIFHGDEANPLTISEIAVSNVADGAANKWDTIDNAYGPASLGLQQARSVMELYALPSRIFEGTVKAKDADFGSVFEMEAVGSERFVLQRGTFNRKLGYIENATFMEIEPGVLGIDTGREGGNTSAPIWILTSDPNGVKKRCVTSGGNNTGYVEIYQEDVNEFSPTFGTFRWTELGYAPTACPIGSPPSYYTGCDDATLDINNLTAVFPETDDADGQLEFAYTNPGGLYVYFVHLASLGTVSQVSIDLQEEIITDFTYQSNIDVGGTAYKVLRQNYITSNFSIQIRFTF